MYKCTHCGLTYGPTTWKGRKAGKTGFAMVEVHEDDVCPECGDGVLRPIKCSCVCHAVFDGDGEPRLCETCALCNPEGVMVPDVRA